MVKRIFVSATNTDIGKTYTTSLLVEAFSKMGYRVGVYKPIETGVITVPLDGEKLFQIAQLHNPSLRSLTLSDIVTLTFPLPAAPYVASGGIKIDFSLFEKSLEKIEQHCDIVIIEGAGGLMVPIDEDRMMIDIPHHFGAVTLLVTHCRLGCINDTLLSLAALEAKGLSHIWALNCRANDLDFDQVSLPYFQYRFNTLYRIERDIDTLARALLDTIS